MLAATALALFSDANRFWEDDEKLELSAVAREMLEALQRLLRSVLGSVAARRLACAKEG